MATLASFGINCYFPDGAALEYCECTSIYDMRFPEIQIKLADYFTFFLKGEDYLLWSESRSMCLNTFSPDSSHGGYFWLLGDPFLRAYYTIYDVDNFRVGITGRIHDSGSPNNFINPTDEEDDGTSLPTFGNENTDKAIKIVVIVVLIVLCCYCCVKCCQLTKRCCKCCCRCICPCCCKDDK